jgi:methylmalonyl-CoA mutase N-terminal domain/subunit
MSERRTESGIPLKPVYTPADQDGSDYAAKLGDPGEYPYARGVRPATAGRRGWIQRELSGEGDPRRSNEQFKFLISKGQSGIDVIGDTPTVGLLDPDHPVARHAVGTQGVSICHLDDYRELYRDLPIDEITLSHSLPPLFLVSALYCVARERGISPSVLRGSVVQSPYYCEDTGYALHMPFDLRERLSVDSIAFAAREMPRFHAFLEDTYYISDGVLDAVEEMALGFIEIRGLIRSLLERGIDADSFAPRIAILVNCRMDVFEEVAKIRATRRLFARMMREEFGARDPRSLAVNVTAHTSGMSLTAQQPLNNVVRGAIQTFGLALAGARAIEVSTFDEAYRPPSPEAHEAALRTQQIVELESNAAHVADPLGGSYFVESLTDEMERRIWEMVQRIEAKGGPAELAANGYFRGLFQSGMERQARALADGTLPKVGVNRYAIPEEQDTLLREMTQQKIEPHYERITEVQEHRKRRDAGRVRGSLEALHVVASDRSTELTPAVIEAFQVGATIGEMAGVMRMAYGQAADPFGLVADPI